MDLCGGGVASRTRRMRMMPATSKQRVDEQRQRRQVGEESVHGEIRRTRSAQL
jgi:hypothetical protein